MLLFNTQNHTLIHPIWVDFETLIAYTPPLLNDTSNMNKDQHLCISVIRNSERFFGDSIIG